MGCVTKWQNYMKQMKEQNLKGTFVTTADTKTEAEQRVVLNVAPHRMLDESVCIS